MDCKWLTSRQDGKSERTPVLAGASD